MDFELLDRYLLDGVPEKPIVIAKLLEGAPPVSQAGAFFEGMRLLGSRTPELTLVALRLVLAGRAATDEAVVELRNVIERARADGAQREAAIERYRELVRT